MPDTVSVVYEALCREIQEIHVRWKLYRQLYGRNQLRFDLMREIASTFFARIHYILLDDVVMGVVRMTDPAKTARNKNLSAYQLRDRLVNNGIQEVANRVAGRLKTLEPMMGPFREQRNKRLAHTDLENRLKTSDKPLPGISRQDIELVLEHLRAVLNDVQEHFHGGHTGYEYVVTEKDADTLIDSMKYAYVFRALLIEDPVKWHPLLEESRFKDA